MAERERAAVHVELLHRHSAHLLGPWHRLGEEGVRVKRLEVRKNLPSKGLVELDHVNILERQARLLEHRGHGVGRAEKQIFKRIARDKDPLAKVRLRREAERLGLGLVHQQRRRRTVGQEGRVGRRDGAVRLDKRGLEAGHLLHRRVLADAAFLGAAVDRRDLLVKDAIDVRLVRGLMRTERVGVLLLASDAETVAEPVGVVAHHLAGREVGDRRGLGRQVLGLDSGEELHFLAHRLGLAQPEEGLAHRAREADRHVAERLDAARDHHLSVARLDLAYGRTDCLIRRDACLRHGVRRHVARNAGAD
mmetsp:Transcript_45525/g.99151  ORF Transcript_45525/g.99151 Transcript_45525/m.99151 type:complete len:306 (-) Transcript_45525:331-1248(-)